MAQNTPPVASNLHQSAASNAKPNAIVFVGGVSVGVIIGVTTFAAANNFDLLPDLTSNNQVTLTSSTTSQILEQVKYQDGIYTAQAEFDVPATGSSHLLQITVEIKDGEIVSAVSTEIEDGAEVTSTYLEQFNEKLSGMIVGKPIESVADMELVSGSTLTSDAFKIALTKVQAEAEAQSGTESLYQDGDYYGQAFFPVPVLGDDKGHIIGVRLTVVDGLVTNVVVNEVAEDGTVIANERFDTFDEEVEKLVIGKPIQSIRDLEIVNGASYTTQGFNDAVDAIYEQAKVN